MAKTLSLMSKKILLLFLLFLLVDYLCAMRYFFTLLILTITISACGNKGCTDPLAANYNSDATKDDGSCEHHTLNINLKITHNGTALSEYDVFEKDGKSFRLETMRYYLSHLSLSSTDGASEEVEVHLYDIDKESTHQIQLNNLKQDLYNSIQFNLGLDEALNSSDPNSFSSNHPLSASNNTYWNMEPASYMFVMFEGKIDSLGGANFDFPKTYHLAHQDLLRSISINHTIDFSESNSLTISLHLEIGEMFNNINISEQVPHSVDSSPTANELMSNISNAFIIE